MVWDDRLLFMLVLNAKMLLYFYHFLYSPPSPPPFRGWGPCDIQQTQSASQHSLSSPTHSNHKANRQALLHPRRLHLPGKAARGWGINLLVSFIRVQPNISLYVTSHLNWLGFHHDTAKGSIDYQVSECDFFFGLCNFKVYLVCYSPFWRQLL